MYETWSTQVSSSYSTDQTVFVGGNSGVCKSVDAGLSFQQINSGLAYTNCNALVISPNYSTDHTLFAGLNGSGVGVYKSTDGTTWVPDGSGLPTSPNYSGPCVDALAISPNYSTDHTVFVEISQNGLFRSEDGGAYWNNINPQMYECVSGGLAISPNYAQDHTVMINAGGYSIQMSYDGGDTWSSLGFPGVAHAFGPVSFSPNFATDKTILCGTSDGLWMTVVPEPSTLILLSIGVTSMLASWRRWAN